MTVPVDELFRAHERPLWELCYRMCGSAADADDLVQETFLRTVERPPPRMNDETEPLRPWLVTVALNLARDLLRRRKRARYAGPWLPSPIQSSDATTTSHDAAALADTGPSPEARYSAAESVTFAFLVALEALPPTQRAVLLLRDVFDYSVRDVAEVLSLSEPNVKTTHHRARKRMDAYDTTRRAPDAAQHAATARAIGQLADCLARQDRAGLARLLTADAAMYNDGAGEFFAARVPVVGPEKIATFLANVVVKRGADTEDRLVVLNGTLAIVSYAAAPPPGIAPLTATLLDLAPDGRITRVYTVLAPRKLRHLRALFA